MPDERASIGAGAGAEDAKRLLDVLAREPRPAGGAAEQAARAHCRAALERLGFTAAEEPFEYSAFPGRYATPLGGLAMLAAFAVAGHVGARGAPLLALGTLLASVAIIAAGGLWLARHGVLDVPLARARAINLVATRGAAPTLWLAAHIDSKSQPVPMAARAAGIVATALLWIAAVVIAGLQAAGGAHADAWGWIAGAALIATAPVILSLVGARSPGAIDNASGVATVLLAARQLPANFAVGVVITSAEELGMAGARAWVRGRSPGTALNCDGVDDGGGTICMYAGRRPGRVMAAAGRAAARTGTRWRARRLLPGVLTDSVAFADAGWQTVTISRGTLRTLSRIHLPDDRMDRLSGAGIADTARFLTALALELQ